VGLVFISYRRCDDAYAAALLDSELRIRFGADEVFRASRSIPPGADYKKAIKAALQESDAIVVVVGRRWEENFRGRDPAEDDVLHEIVMAGWYGAAIVPVLLTGVNRLAEMRLPDQLDGIERLQYLRFDYRAIDQDAGRIAKELKRVKARKAQARERRIRAAALASSGSAQVWPVTGQIWPIES
jgi:hypothetical protein